MKIAESLYGSFLDQGKLDDADPAVGEDLDEDDEFEDLPPPKGLVRVWHTNGAHYLPLAFCNCQGGMDHLNDMIAGKMFPATHTKIQTIFTTTLLDDFRAANLDCKTAAYNYYEKLRRLTCPVRPESVPMSGYPHLRRLARQWRFMKRLKWAGCGNDGRAPKAGELAIFCATCPQPGINLPEDWKEDPNQ
jgi:hypothetical protein